MKSEALMLLSQEMDQCRTQRDQFKLMAEQIQERFLHLKKQMCDMKELNRYLIQDLQYNNIISELFYDPFISLNNKYFCRCYSLEDDFRTLDLLTEAREQNKCLRLQVETLRQKLADAEGDIKVLRTNNNRIPVEQQETQLAPVMHQREEMIEQLEKLNLKVSLKRKN